MNMNLYEEILNGKEKIAVIGLGYVGLPIAVTLSRKVEVIGFDLNKEKIESYRAGIDLTGDIGNEELVNCTVSFTADEAELAKALFFIIAVPTPITSGNVPDLSYVINASKLVGKYLKKNAIVVYESTVYPGVTEEICLPVLEEQSGLSCGTDYKIGYSPERINPGDKVHRLDNIVKIVSGIDEAALNIIAKVYELVVNAGVYRAESIRTAEAAKVIENAQRDINIAFMNELSMLFNKMGIHTDAVIEAASTKWNFLPFKPGLVGGHCIGIDPYYLTYKAEDTGYHSKIILAGRHINDGMGQYVAQQIVKKLSKLNEHNCDIKVGILGFSYKEDSKDIRNTKVIDIIHELQEYGIEPFVFDPIVERAEVYREYGIKLADVEQLKDLQVIVMAVPHQSLTKLQLADFEVMFGEKSVKLFVDIKSQYNRVECEQAGFKYWSL